MGERLLVGISNFATTQFEENGLNIKEVRVQETLKNREISLRFLLRLWYIQMMSATNVSLESLKN